MNQYFKVILSLHHYTVRNLYFFTLYSGTNGRMIGTDFTYFRYSGSLP